MGRLFIVLTLCYILAAANVVITFIIALYVVWSIIDFIKNDLMGRK